MKTKRKSLKKKNILVLIETSRSFGRDLIHGITQYATETKQWNLFLCDQITAIQNQQWLNKWTGDGLIARAYDKRLRRFFDAFAGKKINLSSDGKNSTLYVRLDNERCGQMAVEHFRQRGYHHFAFFSMGHTFWSKYRYDCFRRSLETCGIVCHLCPQAQRRNTWMLPTLWWEGADDSVLAWIESLPKPVAVFCAYDNHAFYLTNLCSISGIAVPESISVLGVDNDVSLCLAVSPSISSIDPNAPKIGYEAAALLDSMMNGRRLPTLPVVVQPSCIVTRQSTDNLAVNDPVLAEALQIIRSEVANRLSVADVVRRLCISKGTLNNLFRKHMSCSPHEEILRIRLEWAKELLRDTVLPIGKISLMIGYQTPEYFCRVFSRETNMTPLTYRFLMQRTGKMNETQHYSRMEFD